MRKVVKQNVGMIFDEHSNPIAIYWKNGTIRHFKLKEANEGDMDDIWEVGRGDEKKKE